MKRLSIASTFLIYALSVSAQDEPKIDLSEFQGKLIAGMEAATRGPHRFITKNGSTILTIEIDANKNIRAFDSNGDGEINSECIIIGERVFERLGRGGWTLQTRQEYHRAEKARTAALSKNDRAADPRRIPSAHQASNKATWAAIHRPLVDSITSDLSNANVVDKQITRIENLEHKGKQLSVYRFRGNTISFTVPSEDLRYLRTEIVYGFDDKTGALLKAQTRHAWVYVSNKKTYINVYEWEPDASIVIAAPALTGK